MRTRTRAVEAAPESGRPSSIGGSRNTPEGPRDRPRRARGSEDLGTRPRASSEPGGAQASRRERASAFPATVHGADTRPEPWPRAPPRVREQVTVEPDRGAASGGFPSGRIVRKSPVLDFFAAGTRKAPRSSTTRAARRGPHCPFLSETGSRRLGATGGGCPIRPPWRRKKPWFFWKPEQRLEVVPPAEDLRPAPCVTPAAKQPKSGTSARAGTPDERGRAAVVGPARARRARGLRRRNRADSPPPPRRSRPARAPEDERPRADAPRKS